ncbi:zinc transporter ZntB [Poseidonibacter parvus]|uniref:Zinc transporter ZntB n=1 Tax=Poseidonibacter parvus TaxID=1850254 RepID=A0A1P8KJS1_9BACT|nr:zinc transporter ZntB [Poseidonibacter parvus]APW64813.1 zinc transporter ZntB [Poseidonibacter parvus]
MENSINENGFCHGIIFDGKGGAKDISFEELDSYDSSMGVLWVHFDYTKEQSIDWITNKSGIDPIAAEALLSQITRPRTTILNDSVLLALRGINLNPNSDPEDMISIRLYLSKNIIISTKKRDLFSVNDILEYFEQGKGPKNSSEFLIELTDRLTDRMEDYILDLEDRASSLEEQSIESSNAALRTSISQIKRESISLKRYLSPQKEAIFKLYEQKITWINEYEKIQLREINHRLIKYIEDLDSIKDKISLVQEEISNNLSEQLNQRMYVLSIISAIFLPLGFLTGLLGVNVGGIPGAENSFSFSIFTISLIFIVVVQLYIFRKKKWL